MSYRKGALLGAAASIAFIGGHARAAYAAEAVTSAAPSSVAEVIVTAQKRQESIQNVGMSIQAASGDKLTKLGITDTASLQKIVPGFTFTPTYYGTTVFTIRGVGFQDSSLAGSPTVSVYVDEAPLPFSALTNGATLDLQRVEVLKGPQGTLFGENATGGAINYIANKPTDTYQAGLDLSYGTFSDTSVQGFVSGPITDGLDARLALQSHTSGAWQKGYGPQSGQSTGGQDFLNGRVAVRWKPTDKFTALLTLNGWQDKGYNQDGQLYGIASLSPTAVLAPAIKNFPLAPHNDQAADFMSCVNVSPFDPLSGGGPNQGPGSAVYTGAQPTDCLQPRKNNSYYAASLRMDYELGDDLVLTSLTEYQKFNRKAAIDGAGMPIQDYQTVQYGKISSVYQELRLAGKFQGKGSWLVGVNYEYDNTWDRFLQTYNASSNSPAVIPRSFFCQAPTGGGPPPNGVGYEGLFTSCSPAQQALPAFVVANLGPTEPVNAQQTNTYAVYANAEYPIRDNLILQGGVRFTQENKNYQGCGNDGGDGSWGAVSQQVHNLFEVVNGTISPDTYLNLAGGAAGGVGGNGINAGPGGCGSSGPGPTFNPPPGGALYTAALNQNNVSWRVGLNWKVTPEDLLYFNVSQGWKGGSFPTVSSASAAQLVPVVQEGLLAYEGGFKLLLLDRSLQLNGAGFYYDYTNKQILGSISDAVFGALPALVNVPQSHVVGFELSAIYSPNWLRGLTITPAVSYQDTQIDKSAKNTCLQAVLGATPCVGGDFYSFDAFNHYTDFTGEHFPLVPQWQVSVDGEYDWKVRDNVTAYVGLNYRYVTGTNSNFINRAPPAGSAYDPEIVPAYGLLDLRAGISKDNWRFQVWARNVTNQWYWTSAVHVADVLVRYTGQPTTVGFTLNYRYN